MPAATFFMSQITLRATWSICNSTYVTARRSVTRIYRCMFFGVRTGWTLVWQYNLPAYGPPLLPRTTSREAGLALVPGQRRSMESPVRRRMPSQPLRGEGVASSRVPLSLSRYCESQSSRCIYHVMLAWAQRQPVRPVVSETSPPLLAGQGGWGPVPARLQPRAAVLRAGTGAIRHLIVHCRDEDARRHAWREEATHLGCGQ
jgi:hypothetical protein